MTHDRAWKLTFPERHPDEPDFTQAELDAGYHACWDWDGLVIGPDFQEWQVCDCACRHEYEERRKNDGSDS